MLLIETHKAYIWKPRCHGLELPILDKPVIFKVRTTVSSVSLEFIGLCHQLHGPVQVLLSQGFNLGH